MLLLKRSVFAYGVLYSDFAGLCQSSAGSNSSGSSSSILQLCAQLLSLTAAAASTIHSSAQSSNAPILPLIESHQQEFIKLVEQFECSKVRRFAAQSIYQLIFV